MSVDHLKDFQQEKDKARITVCLPKTMDNQLRQMAQRDGLTTSDVIRRIINDTLRRPK